MTIMGLQCAPDVARRAQLGELGWETSSALQLDHMNTAYGYIAQVVVFLGHVLDVPPLYQLELEGSYCRVQQYMPRTLRPAGAEPDLYEVRPLKCRPGCRMCTRCPSNPQSCCTLDLGPYT